jgi:hypothetical protein
MPVASSGIKEDRAAGATKDLLARGSMIALAFELEVRLVTYQCEVVALNLGNDVLG